MLSLTQMPEKSPIWQCKPHKNPFSKSWEISIRNEISILYFIYMIDGTFPNSFRTKQCRCVTHGNLPPPLLSWECKSHKNPFHKTSNYKCSDWNPLSLMINSSWLPNYRTCFHTSITKQCRTIYTWTQAPKNSNWRRIMCMCRLLHYLMIMSVLPCGPIEKFIHFLSNTWNWLFSSAENVKLIHNFRSACII